jgi:hypothetical protein
MMPGDGSFDSAVEAIWGIASLAGLGYGEHLVNVRARNPLGTWGDGGAAVISITPVDGIFADGFESGDLSAWSSATGGAQLTVESGAAMAGGYGLVTRLSGKSAAYVADASPAAATAYRARFWFAPRGTVTGVKPIDIFVGRSSAAAIFRVQYQHASGGELRVRLGIARKRGTAYSGWIAISDTAHAIELAWSSSAAATVWLHLDGTVADAVIGLNTSAYRLESVLIGPSGGMSASASGSLWFDGLVSTESTAIGL